ncbi:MAG: DUF349 domain-containing protein [Crocinitomicaceae bacterium]|nr:DUF349 domain-containing protein [Crocinitomicaceae bacterium]
MKSEIIEKLKELAQQDKVLDSLTEFTELVNEFHKLQSEEERQWELKKIERIEAGEKPENIEKPVYEYMEDFKKLTALFKDKKKIEVNEIKEREKGNLDKKKALIAALADLIQNEENIGRAIARFKDIQDSWNEAGTVPREHRQEIQNEFSNLVESFRYNINIYKEIKDHDLGRNLKLKKELIEKLKQLLDLKIIKEVEEKLHAYQDEWNNIGGTHQEEWEKIKGEYWETVNAVYEKIHQFYKSRREERSENIEKKKALIEKAKSIASKEINSHKSWKKNTDALIALQNEWKTIGFGPKDENKEVWKEFRSICNEFFARKKEFYGERNEQFDGVKEAKEKLIAEVASLKESTDWKETTKRIMNIQKKWKEAGSAGPKHENRLWKEFRGHIDQFFESKDKHFKNAEAGQKENLKAKEELIKKIKAYKPVKDAKKAAEKLKEFATQFAEIGNVPFKQKDKIYKAYKDAMKEQYEALDLDPTEKEEIMFEAKLESIRNSNDPEEMIDRERRFIRRKMGKLKEEIAKFETNMSFFNADEDNPLLKTANESLENSKAEFEGMKVQLTMLRELEDELEEEEVEEESEVAEVAEMETTAENQEEQPQGETPAEEENEEAPVDQEDKTNE